MDKLFDCWQTFEPILVHLKPYDISRLAFTNKGILSYIQKYFMNIKKQNKQTEKIVEFGDDDEVFVTSVKYPLIKITATKNNTNEYRFIWNTLHDCNFDQSVSLIVEIKKIIKCAGYAKIYGWILSGKNILHMNINNKKEFRPYPMHCIINSGNAHQFEMIPYKSRKKDAFAKKVEIKGGS